METCTRKVNSHFVSRSVYLMGLFDWRLVKEDKYDGAPSVLHFERDNDDTPYYREMVEIEKEASPKLLPFWILILFVAIAFALITTALIMALTKVMDPIVCFLAFFIPASIFLAADVLVFYLRSKQLLKYLNNEKEIVKQAEEKMKALKEKYGK